jgi:hypothetical protein
VVVRKNIKNVMGRIIGCSLSELTSNAYYSKFFHGIFSATPLYKNAEKFCCARFYTWLNMKSYELIKNIIDKVMI